MIVYNLVMAATTQTKVPQQSGEASTSRSVGARKALKSGTAALRGHGLSQVLKDKQKLTRRKAGERGVPGRRQSLCKGTEVRESTGGNESTCLEALHGDTN